MQDNDEIDDYMDVNERVWKELGNPEERIDIANPNYTTKNDTWEQGQNGS